MIPYHTHQPLKFFLCVVCWLVAIVFELQCVYSPSAAYMRQWTEWGLVQVMACRLFRHQAMLAYCQVDSWEQISVTFEAEFYHFYYNNTFGIVIYQIGGHFVQGEMSYVNVKAPAHVILL